LSGSDHGARLWVADRLLRDRVHKRRRADRIGVGARFVNAVIRPILFFVTLPLTVLTLGCSF